MSIEKQRSDKFLTEAIKAWDGSKSLEDVLAKLTAGGNDSAHFSKDGSEVIWKRFSYSIEGGEVVLYETLIRKLTPVECYRLMGFQRKDSDACYAAGQRDANVYHQSGDSIVVTVLMAIFGELLGIDYRNRIVEYADSLAKEGKR